MGACENSPQMAINGVSFCKRGFATGFLLKNRKIFGNLRNFLEAVTYSTRRNCQILAFPYLALVSQIRSVLNDCDWNAT